ncbi:MAG: NUDIX domain-containing protein [Candidatus Colwellbacteria bacterium]|nr:NUDIX domain-containing protein [Candidatus Colwellbacteria bacterium]
MNILGTIIESDIFPNQIPVPSEQYGELRRAVRVVLFDEEKNVALEYYPPKEAYPNEEYDLPGGGVEGGESMLGALAREVLEEVGCRIKNVRKLGVIKEFGVGNKIKHAQDSYCFTAEIEGDKGQPQFTEREKQDLVEVRWLRLDEAIKKISNQNASFERTRSLMCLESLGLHG